MRVYELAKMLGMESRQLIPELVRLGISVTSHSNSLNEGEVQRALEALATQSDRANMEMVLEKLKRKTEGDRKGGKKSVLRGAKTREREDEGMAALEGESPKPGKKHILIKRKREEEQEVPREHIDEEGERQPESTLEAVPPGVSAEESVRGEPQRVDDLRVSPEVAAIEASEQTSERAATVAVPPTEEGVEEERASGRFEKKEKGEARVLELEEEKVRKARKLPRQRDEDLFAERYEDAARWQDLRPLPTLRREERVRHAQPTAPVEVTKPRKKTVKLSQGITVKEFSELLGQRPADVIRKLMEMGVPLTLNQPMNLDAGVLIAEGLGVAVEVSQEKEGEALLEELLQSTGEERWVPRPPVVTVMGHVDHGKTSLLDAIRQSNVTDREAGGITQHIGAYTVNVGGKRITFLDTPGHEAFTAMRARGAQVTDIVVLVVAADDGVMPQTVEAVHHAQAANVPIIVAINKIDKPGANPERVKHGLAEHGLIPESWGGQTIYVEVSAKQKLGLDALLEMILLQAEILELRANLGQPAQGVVLEAKLDRGRGPVATVLVQHGLLRTGDVFVVGTTHGRVRAMMSHDGRKLSEADPSTPVEVIGLLGLPAAGDQFVVVKDERVAREIAETRLHKQRLAELSTSGSRLTVDDLYAQHRAQDKKELALVVKADVQGSVGALCESIRKLSTEAVHIQIIHSGVGGITESDVLLASASRAMIVGFHVRPEPKAAALAEREGVEMRLHTVIYNVLADVKAAAEGLLEPTYTERILGRAEVRQLFTIPKVGTIAGCYVHEGSISRSSEGVRVLRDHVTVYEGKIASLRRFKDDVKEVQQGYECGIGIENFHDLKIGDVIEAYVHEKEAAKL
ncbi:MAG: translation initiation factor IF-2 [Nitrospirae bacterium]|nr:MAG: translation initiation factor IF-2 [Nitrospirota bacterium]